jgi:hypothetical protein
MKGGKIPEKIGLMLPWSKKFSIQNSIRLYMGKVKLGGA